jgi:arylsulfatase A
MNKIALVLLFLVYTLQSCNNNTQKVDSKSTSPNIVIIMADDMGYGDPGCYNPESKIPTPNMDKLCSQGVRFTDAHSADAVCTPSRYGLLTGRYCWRTTLKKTVLWSGFDEPLITPERPTLASVLRKHGYKTGIVGKWHLGLNFSKTKSNSFVEGKNFYDQESARDVDFNSPVYGGPNYLGFDYSFISAAGHNMEPYCYIENDFAVGIPTIWHKGGQEIFPGVSASETSDGWMVEGWDPRLHGTDFTKKATNFIAKSHAENPAQPFFLYLPTTSPHRPCTPPDFIKGKSEAGDRGDMVAEFDWTVGEIMKTLDSLKIAENTIIIVTSDNGAPPVSDDGKDYGHKSCGNLHGFKGSLYEGGHRVPFIIRWPNVLPANTENDGMICLTDLFATFSNLTGEKTNNAGGEDSFDLMALLKEGKQARNTLVMHDYSGNFAIRENEWKLLLNGNQTVSRQNELYNLKTDPQEKENVIEKHPEIVKKLTDELNRYKWQGYSNY